MQFYLYVYVSFRHLNTNLHASMGNPSKLYFAHNIVIKLHFIHALSYFHPLHSIQQRCVFTWTLSVFVEREREREYMFSIPSACIITNCCHQPLITGNKVPFLLIEWKERERKGRHSYTNWRELAIKFNLFLCVTEMATSVYFCSNSNFDDDCQPNQWIRVTH